MARRQGKASSPRESADERPIAGGRYPIDNLTYDVLTVLHAKAKALEAYDKYLHDARGDDELRRLLEQIREQDVRMIHELRQHLSRLLQGGESPRTGSRRAA